MRTNQEEGEVGKLGYGCLKGPRMRIRKGRCRYGRAYEESKLDKGGHMQVNDEVYGGHIEEYEEN